MPTIHPERYEGGFAGKIGSGNPWLSKIFNFPKKFEIKMRDFFYELTSQSGRLYYLIVPSDVKLRESWVGNVG